MTDLNKSSTRSTTELLISIEEKLLLLTKMLVTNDMNNKLILDRLNRMFKNSEPIVNTANSIDSNKIDNATRTKKSQSNKTAIESKESKIPVGQRVVDGQGKDLFFANVNIYDIDNNVVGETKTNAVGKWQTYLPVGKFIIKIISNTDKNKIESSQVVEIQKEMKSLQLPIFSLKQS